MSLGLRCLSSGLGWGRWSLGWGRWGLGWGSWSLGWLGWSLSWLTLGRLGGSLGRGSWGLGWGSRGLGSLFGLLESLLLGLLELLDEVLVDFSVASDMLSLGLLVFLLPSESLGSDQSLDSRSLVELLVTDGLGWSLDDISADIEAVDSNLGLVLGADLVGVLWKAEQLSDLVGSLWTKSSWGLGVGQASDLGGSLGDDGEVNTTNVSVDDASSNASSLSLTFSTESETRGAWWDEESCSALLQNTVLHGETILIASTADSQNVTLKGLSEDLLAINFLSDLHVDDLTPLVFFFNLEAFAQAMVSGAYDEFHP